MTRTRDIRRGYLVVFFAWAVLGENTAEAKPIRIQGVVRLATNHPAVGAGASVRSADCGMVAEVPASGRATDVSPAIDRPAAADGRPATDTSAALGAPRLEASLEGVLVYVDGPKLRGRRLSATRSRLILERCALEPSMLVVGVGSSVRFENADPVVHSVVIEDERARVIDRISLVGRAQTSPWVRLRRPGRYVAHCVTEGHQPSARAGILALGDRLFTRTDKNGGFELSGVPMGRIEIIAWDPRFGESRAPVRVGRDGLSAPLELVLGDPPASPVREP
ncbi:MAG: hypothetical protein IPK13_18790 [Deltaproteobacteria bacterium]|nr:hypothetical protein [Deltaproteobacteria bacterium]